MKNLNKVLVLLALMGNLALALDQAQIDSRFLSEFRSQSAAQKREILNRLKEILDTAKNKNKENGDQDRYLRSLPRPVPSPSAVDQAVKELNSDSSGR